MSGATSSEHIQLLIAGYVLGDLSSDEAEELARLIRENPALSREINALQEISETTQGITEVAPPAHLKSRILAPELHKPHTPAIASPPSSRRILSWPLVGGAIAASLILALGINNYRLWVALQVTRTELAQAQSGSPPIAPLMYSLESAEASSPASASVVVDPDTLEAQLTAQNLPALPPEKVYAVWTVPQEDAPVTTDAKGAILTGVFQVEDDSPVSTTLTVPVVYRRPELVAKVAVTVEDAVSPQQHTGSIVLISQ